ncbi:hypothetical protein CFC21_100023 [Triticum aestivum]|uniref:Knottin scorpion toxin-like domain-containing protein n=2 Tax=Triticum aestivum TaxID=4565 RepID=A0A3B6RQZ2_WHEAT|nr:hypothetical protein CFC21_100023 [Triticum aestivum]
MTPSEKNLCVIVLLIVIVAAVCPLPSMAFACAEPTQCRHLSGNYRGPCFGFTDGCDTTCQDESSDNRWGECDCDFKCYCYTC